MAVKKFAGICRLARRNRWKARFIKHGRMPLSTYLKIWHPVGVITDNAQYRPSHIPTVALDGDKVSGDMNVVYDRRAAARLAAAEFCNMKIPNFAFVPPPEEYAWSDERRDAFVHAIGASGHDVHVFPKRRRESTESVAYLERLATWLKRLPKPCGLLAANDATAEQVLACAALAGVAVPNELAVIGVDDDQDICENTFPPLTSISPAFEEAGARAAEALGLIMEGKIPDNRDLSYGNQGITRRKSTGRIFGHVSDVHEARALIRREACLGLKAREVAAHMRGSRRHAEIRFKAITGRTILGEIENTRLTHAKRLLAGTSKTLAEVARACGYVSASHLRKAFEKRTGMTMGAWRSAHKQLTGGPSFKGLRDL